MDYFILVINKDEHIISSEFALNHDGARSDCGMKVDLYSLCGKLTRAASDYYHSNKELFDFFPVSVNTIIRAHTIAAKFHCELCRFSFLPKFVKFSKTVFKTALRIPISVGVFKIFVKQLSSVSISRKMNKIYILKIRRFNKI